MMTSRRFLIYFLLLSAIVIVTTIGFEVWSFRRAIDHSLQQNLLFASSVARNVASAVDDQKGIVEATLNAVEQADADPKSLGPALQALRAANPDLEAIAVFDAQRQLVAGELTPTTRPPLDILLPALRMTERTGRVVLTDLWKAVDRRPRVAVLLGRVGETAEPTAKGDKDEESDEAEAAPAKAAGPAPWRAAVAVMRVDGPRFSKVLERFMVDPASRLQLLDSSGVALYSTESGENFQSVVHGTYFTDKVRLGATAQMQCHSCHLGERHDETVREQEVTTVAPVPGTDWTVTVREQAQRLFAPMTETVYLSTALVCLIFGLFVGFYVLLSRRVLRPMRQLAITATRLESGPGREHSGLSNRDEFEVLNQSLRALQARPNQAGPDAMPAAREPRLASTAGGSTQHIAMADLQEGLGHLLDGIVAGDTVGSVLLHLRGWPLGSTPFYAARGAVLRAEGVLGDTLAVVAAGRDSVGVADLRERGIIVEELHDTKIFRVLPIVVPEALEGQLWIGVADTGETVSRYLGPALTLIATQVQSLVERQLLQSQLRREQEHKNRMLRHLFDAEAEERKRIAREIHDQTAQELTALMLMLETAGDAGEAGAAKHLERAKALVGQILDGLNRLVRRLRPAVLDDLGLIAAVRATGQNLFEPAGVAFELEAEGNDAGLGRELESGVYRVFQEAATNILRHAGAKTVRTRLHIESDRLMGWIEDDGKGMDLAWLDDLAARPRWGLLGMRERIVQLGGTIEFTRAESGGLRIVFDVPAAEATGDDTAPTEA